MRPQRKLSPRQLREHQQHNHIEDARYQRAVDRERRILDPMAKLICDIVVIMSTSAYQRPQLRLVAKRYFRLLGRGYLALAALESHDLWFKMVANDFSPLMTGLKVRLHDFATTSIKYQGQLGDRHIAIAADRAIDLMPDNLASHQTYEGIIDKSQEAIAS